MQLEAQIFLTALTQPELRTIMYSMSVLLVCVYTNSSRIPAKGSLTQTDSEMAFSPDAEIKEQVLVELL